MRSGTWGAVLRDLLAFHPAEGTRRVGTRAAVTMGIALAVLSAAGRVDWSIYATFGAFASIYGGGRPRPQRWRLQAGLGALLAAAVGCGALVGTSEWRSWIAIPVTAAWATTGAVLSDRYSWRPPGPLFVVFAVATCAAIPTAPAGVLAAMGVAAATATFAVVLGFIESRWLPGRSWNLPAAMPPPAPRHRQRIHAIRCAGAVAAAGLIATTAGISHPYWAMIAAIVPLTVRTLRAQLVRGAQRTAGTALGLITAGLLLLVPMPTMVTIVVIAGLQACAELLVVRNYGLALIAITPLALLSMQLANPEPVATLLVDRLVDGDRRGGRDPDRCGDSRAQLNPENFHPSSRPASPDAYGPRQWQFFRLLAPAVRPAPPPRPRSVTRTRSSRPAPP